MNTVTLIGHLATDVELRELGEERTVANFLLAVQRTGTTGGADFVRVSAWDKQALVCSRFLAKGKRVGVEGRLRSHSWEEADGRRRTAVEVQAHRVEFLSVSEEERTPFAEAAPA